MSYFNSFAEVLSKCLLTSWFLSHGNIFYIILPQTFLTPYGRDGLLTKYLQFPDVLNALNVQPHNIILRTI